MKKNKPHKWTTVTQSVCNYEHAKLTDFIGEITYTGDAGPYWIGRGWEVQIRVRKVFDFSGQEDKDDN